MLLDPKKSVRDFAIEIPNATRVFEKLKIDYCCGEDQPLDEACNVAGLEVEEVFRLLGQGEPAQVKPDASDSPSLLLAELADRIVENHHVFTREELERLTALLEKVCSVHGGNHPELLTIQSEFQTLRAELEPHMLKEERILFPYIKRLEVATITSGPLPFAPFGTVHNPIAAMMREHDAAGDILKTIRKLSGDFVVPEGGCFSYRTVYGALEVLEADLHQHIHLENNILFPRAEEMEQRSQVAAV
ncbi:MAG TPA: iron-sulfur cluster repair di-iron protein [Pyrinomonadaceae bacterium]|nr:iron-sulfur cluster repair di-iron protein [Pyrinomonadaceae bacterium]